MKELVRNIEGFIAVSAVIVLLWVLISWADVLLYQFAGEPAWWNLFVILTEVTG